MNSTMYLLPALVIMLLFLFLIRAAGRRFERDAIRRGRWDKDGPLVETRGPEGGRGQMGERQEVVGEWEAPVVKDRRHRSHDDA